MVRSIGYEHSTSTLELEFAAGTVYQYSDVPEFIYRALMRAESKHAFFASAIEGRYPFIQIR